MMYSQKLVCSVKIGNKILREKIQDNECTVFVPFGSEYSLLLKNLAGRNAVVHIQIDGKEVSKSGIYMTAGKEGEIQGFIDGYVAERAFRFIQKTQEISDFRGDKIDDGMIRVTWQFEKPLPEVKEVIYNYKHTPRYHPLGCKCAECYPHWWYGPIYTSLNTSIGYSSGGGTQSSTGHLENSSFTVCNSSTPTLTGLVGKSACNFVRSAEVNNDEGITVEGSKVGQSFKYAHARELESNVHSMVIILKGYEEKNAVRIAKAVFVRDKKQCPSCGRKYKGNIEFCPKDGTALKS